MRPLHPRCRKQDLKETALYLMRHMFSVNNHVILRLQSSANAVTTPLDGMQVRDSHLTGRPLLGNVSFPLSRLPSDGALDAWLPVMDAQPISAPAKPVGEIHLKFTFKVCQKMHYVLEDLLTACNIPSWANSHFGVRQARRHDPPQDHHKGE